MKRLLPVVLALLLAAPAGAVEIKRVVSPGGIEAWLIEAHDNPLFAMSFSFDGGSALDPEGKEGLSTLLAATLDEGAGDLDSLAFRHELTRRSIQLSYETGQDYFTGKLVALTREQDRAFALLGLSLTAARFDAEPIARMKSQVLSLIARKQQDPEAIASEKLAAILYPGHPYGRTGRGTEESLSAITAQDLRDLAGQRLTRQGLLIGVVGDLTPEQLAPLLDAAFAALPAGEAPRVTQDVVPQGAGTLTVFPYSGSQSALQMAQPGLKRDDPDYYAANVVNYILGGSTFESRLYLEVREKRGLAYGAWSSLSARPASGVWYGGASTKNESVAEVLEIFRAEWARLAAEGPSDAEIADAIDYLTGSFALKLTSSAGIAELMVSIQRENLGIDYIDRREEIYRSVTPEDVRRVARDWLDPDKLAIVVVGQPVGVVSEP